MSDTFIAHIASGHSTLCGADWVLTEPGSSVVTLCHKCCQRAIDRAILRALDGACYRADHHKPGVRCWWCDEVAPDPDNLGVMARSVKGKP